ncbi:uncharacterized protein [Anabrus simplex]|uniref:uncharacterized protein n=1 Tax=Anabrus simplex TaxID=316456 RepID=UPI0035A38A73
MLTRGVFSTWLVLAVIYTALGQEEDANTNETFRPFEPTRHELYRQFAQELHVVADAEEHVKQVYHTTTTNMRKSVSFSILEKLQGLMDSVGASVEDVLAIAENDGKTTSVTSCTSGKDVEAENVVKGALEEMRHCVEKLAAEGENFAQQAARIVSQMEDVLKKLVTAVEECLSANSDSSGDEKEQVKMCLVSEPVKELITAKENAFKPLTLIMEKVFATEKHPPECINELFHKAEDDILEMKKSITNCVKQTERDEL